jgi:integrase
MDSAASTSPSCLELFEAWIKARQPGVSTINRWRVVFRNLQSHFAGCNADSITEQEAREWIEGLVTQKRTARTILDIWLPATRTVFGWALDEHVVQANPFVVVTITAPKKARFRETEAFTADETETILKAALAVTDTTSPFSAACRWVPWLCAYTGARIGEIAQVRGADIIKQDGIDALRLLPESASTNGSEGRTVPIHEHLIAQGFLEYVATKGSGPLFYTPDRASIAAYSPSNPRRPGALKARERLAGWVRQIGVKDRTVRPNQAWRHTFKQIAMRHDISERIADEITGHAPLAGDRGDRNLSLSGLAEAFRRFPRYTVGSDKSES